MQPRSKGRHVVCILLLEDEGQVAEQGQDGGGGDVLRTQISEDRLIVLNVFILLSEIF